MQISLAFRNVTILVVPEFWSLSLMQFIHEKNPSSWRQRRREILGSICSLPSFLNNLPVFFLHGLLLPSVVYGASNAWAFWGSGV